MDTWMDTQASDTQASDQMLQRAGTEQVVDQLFEQLTMGRTFQQLFDSLYERLRGIVPYNRIAVALLEQPGNLLRLTSCHSDGPPVLKVGYAAHIDGSTLQALLESGQPRILNDLSAYLRGKPQSASTSLIVREGMRSSLTLPLVAAGKPIGVIFFSCRKAAAYEPAHAALLKRLAGHIALSIEKTQLIEQLRRSNAELAAASRDKDEFLNRLRQEVDRRTRELQVSEQRYRLLVQMGRIANSSLELDRVFQASAEQIRDLLQCDRVSLLLVGGRGMGRYGLALEFTPRRRLIDLPFRPLPGTAMQWVLDEQLPRLVGRLADRSVPPQPRFPEDQALYEQGFRSYIYLPLVCRDQSVGVLGVASRHEEAGQWDTELLCKLGDQLAIALDNATAYEEIARLKTQLEEQNTYLRDEIKRDHDFGSIIGDSPGMRQVREAIEQVAKTDATVLILGETGTGKELIARAIHDASPRGSELLVKVNCAALSSSLVTSELFGHEAGAFTGALQRRVGRFELAGHGTIFLDEISEIPPETQVMLLRVLQERMLERVGGNEGIPVHARVIAATNRDLALHVDQGNFRRDLYYRLHVFPIRVPPLRERREDIPALINHFINRFARRMNKDIQRVDRRTMEWLMAYEWPGNVRELENVIERAMVVCPADTLAIEWHWLGGGTAAATTEKVAAGRTWAEIEKQALLDALQQCSGKIYGADGAAARLGLKPTTLYGKLRKYRIHRQRTVQSPTM